MEPPADERKADSDTEPPDFEELDEPAEVVRRGRTRDRIYTTVLQLDEPTTVSDIADRADSGPDAAREYLRWFADMGVVRQTAESPEQYVVNRPYLHWRRANRLCEEYDETELVSRLQDVVAELDSYRERYDEESPVSIVVSEAATVRDVPIEDVWQDITAWESARGRRDVLELALQMCRQKELPGRVVGREANSTRDDLTADL